MKKCPPPSMLISETSKLFHDRLRELLETYNMRRAYPPIFFVLSRAERALTQQEVTERTHFRASSTSVTLQLMEADGFVQRRTDNIDQRVTRVSLTEKGMEADEAIRSCLESLDAQMVHNLSEDDKTQLNTLLQKVRDNLLGKEDKN